MSETKKKSETMTGLFQSARRVSVPLVAIRTADQAATVNAIRPEVGDFPFIQWDAAAGLRTLNDVGKKPLEAAIKAANMSAQVGFTDALDVVARMPRGTVSVMLNAHRQIQSTEPAATAIAVQAVANCRDVLKRDNRMLVLLGPGFTLPAELDQDIVVLRHELPGAEVLRAVITDLVAAVEHEAGFVKPTEEQKDAAVHAIGGLSEFAAEQVTAMSLAPTGLDLDALWERKRTAVEQTRGLKVYRGGEKFSDIVGLENVKARLMQRKNGRTPVGVVLVLDEIDKVLANVEHDTSGVRMDQLRTLLTEMEDNEWEGLLLAGLPGGGKSYVAKAFGNEVGVPTVMLDLGAMEGSLVGESEERIRHAIDVVKAIGGGNAYIVATSNNATVMRPELQRRMTGGFFFVDLMRDAEKAAAWAYYIKRYGLSKKEAGDLPDDTAWSAAEIRNCVREAWNCRVTLKEAARFIMPVAQARATEFEAMREYANGRYLDANVAGETYKHTEEVMEKPLRSLSLTHIVPSTKESVN